MKHFMEMELEVGYTYHRGYLATREEPGEPSHITIESVKYNGQELELTEQDYDAILEACWEDYELTAYGDW